MIESILVVYLLGCIFALIFSSITVLFLPDPEINWWGKMRFIFMWTFGWPIFGLITYYKNYHK
jgi:hypothetical protein